MTIQWKLETRKVSSLKEWAQNPRYIQKEDFQRLKNCLSTYGIIDRPCVNLDGTLIGGHQRKRAFKDLCIKEVECWVPDRQLTEDEARKLALSLNKISGDWDYEMLGNLFDPNELLELGWSVEELDLGAEEVESEEPEGAESSEEGGAKMLISFASNADLQKAENKIRTIVDAFKGSNCKVKLK